MSDRWEYKLVIWSSSTRFQKERRHPQGSITTKQLWRSVFTIKEGGKEPEERLNYSNHAEDEEVEQISLEELLAEFGTEGWELVSETVLDSVIVREDSGWTNVGTPLKTRWVMKRRAKS